MRRRWCVVNLGDAGRSPRTTNHVSQLAAAAAVDYIAYVETEVPTAVRAPSVRFFELHSRLGTRMLALPTALYFIGRLALDFILLIWLFAVRIRRRYDCILIQNPYSLPALPLIAFYRLCNPQTTVIVDMHNFGYTLLDKKIVTRRPSPFASKSAALKAIGMRIAVWLYRIAEVFLVRMAADRVLAVSQAMANVLCRDWRISPERVYVLRDAPNANFFKKLSLREKHEFFFELQCLGDGSESLIARADGESVVELADRPLIATVSSSWAPDDDFETLIEAVELYKANGVRRRLALFFTGTGQRKRALAPTLKALSGGTVQIFIKWFSGADYARMLGASDFTICLHNSVSRVDLPIKLLDSFACEVPALALNYAPTIGELVNAQNGRLFNDAKELCALLAQMGGSPPVFAFARASWQFEWERAFGRL